MNSGPGTTHRGESLLPGRYRTIVADPPWPIVWKMGTTRVNGRGVRYRVSKRDLGYPTMEVDAIAALPVAEIAELDAHLYLWIPDQFLIAGAGARVCKAWGFTPGRLLVWRKRGFGLGTFPRPQHEALIVAKRGKLRFRVSDVGSVQDWKFAYEHGTRAHSRKPDGALDLIERASPGPYLELFARRQRLGWETWGNQALQHVAMEVRGV